MNTLTFFAYSYRLFWSCFSVFGFVAALLGVVGKVLWEDHRCSPLRAAGRTAVGSAIVSGERGRRPRRPTNVGEKRGTAAPKICRKRGGATTRASKRKAGRPRLILWQDFSTQVEFKCCVTLPYVPRLCNGA